MNEGVVDVDLVEQTVSYICRKYPLNDAAGAILIFMPGLFTITKVVERLRQSRTLRDENLDVYALHGSLSPDEQRKAISPSRPRMRKIVVSTNIAETSVTIEDVVYVINTGRVNEMCYDPTKQMSTLNEVWACRASGKQRKGRAGRVRPGMCFHLFSRRTHEHEMVEFQQPEIMRVPLEEVILQIKLRQLGSISEFLLQALDPPPQEMVERGVQMLQELHALTRPSATLKKHSGAAGKKAAVELTPLGFHLAQLPVHPRIGKMLIFGSIFRCLDPVLTIASAMTMKSPFLNPMDPEERELAQQSKSAFAGSSGSDHLAVLAAFNDFMKIRESGGGWRGTREFCSQNYISSKGMDMIARIRTQFRRELRGCGFINQINVRELEAGRASGNMEDVNSKNVGLIKCILCAGLYPNVVRIGGKGRAGTAVQIPARTVRENKFPRTVRAFQILTNKPLC